MVRQHHLLLLMELVQNVVAFAFQYAILITMVLTTFIKYILHTVDLQSENPWDNKAVYMLYTELFTGTALLQPTLPLHGVAVMLAPVLTL